MTFVPAWFAAIEASEPSALRNISPDSLSMFCAPFDMKGIIFMPLKNTSVAFVIPDTSIALNRAFTMAVASLSEY